MTMHKALHLRDDIESMCQEKGGGRELANIEDYVNATIQGFEEYTKKNIERLIAAASNSNINIT